MNCEISMDTGKPKGDRSSDTQDIEEVIDNVASLINQQRWVEASESLSELKRRSLIVKPEARVKVCEFNGIVAFRTGKYKEAAEWFDAIDTDEAHDALTYFNIGVFWDEVGESEKAIRYLFRSLDKKNSLWNTYYAIGLVKQHSGHHEEALFFFKYALKLCKGNKQIGEACSISLLSLGRFEEGWKEFENRKHSWNLDWLKPDWEYGQSLEDKSIAIIVDEGIGDAIMFSGLIEEATRKARDHVVYCDRRLVSLLRRSMPNVCFESQVLDNRFKDYDIRIRLASLASIFWKNKRDVERKPPYLVVDVEQVGIWRKRLGLVSAKKVVIGIAWGGGEYNRMEQKRKRLDLIELCNMVNQDFVDRVVILQHNASEKDLKTAEQILKGKMIYKEGLTQNIDILASVIQSCHMVISSEQTVAHISGAIGTKCLVVCSDPPGWRYACSGEITDDAINCLWYETVRMTSRAHDYKRIALDMLMSCAQDRCLKW